MPPRLRYHYHRSQRTSRHEQKGSARSNSTAFASVVTRKERPSAYLASFQFHPLPRRQFMRLGFTFHLTQWIPAQLRSLAVKRLALVLRVSVGRYPASTPKNKAPDEQRDDDHRHNNSDGDLGAN